jgi:hypothetical protein
MISAIDDTIAHSRSIFPKGSQPLPYPPTDRMNGSHLFHYYPLIVIPFKSGISNSKSVGRENRPFSYYPLEGWGLLLDVPLGFFSVMVDRFLTTYLLIVLIVLSF